ncbi:primary-amine oxidase [Ceratobasidium sp. AG-Ba]|nr:primary-amine oxidase [Ceratobasidium sp. AG-Ba]
MNPPGTKTELTIPAHPAPAKGVAQGHPLDPLSATEISEISTTIRYFLATETPVQAFKFLGAELVLPPKRDVLAQLGIRSAPDAHPGPPMHITRKAHVDIIDVVSGFCWLAHLSLLEGKWNIDNAEKLPEGRQPQISINELVQAADVVRADERVQKLAADVGVTPDQIFADGWSLGYDERFPQKLRLQQCILFARFEKDENLYAHPLDFVPIIDANAQKVIHIDFPSHPTSNVHNSSLPYSTKPPPLTDDPALQRKRIPPPMMKHEYLPDHIEESKVPRESLKPLHVVQPEGVSFRMTGRVLEWQQWKMHIGFSPREGIVISTVTYNDGGDIRPIFYRMSCAEMLVPYGSPDHPHPRKFAFDVGEYGIGLQANELSLGCDCLGCIHYLSGSFIGHDGNPLTIKNAICIHEEDAGLLWKHTDFRPGGRSHSVRFRYMLAEDENATFGTQVAPRINAHNHQHLFSIRIDPMVDGINNTVIESDIVPYPHAAGSPENYAGNGFVSLDKPILKASGRDYNHETDRRWRIINASKLHYSSGLPVAYSVGVGSVARTALAAEGSWIRQRAVFCDKALWIVPEDESTLGGRRWPAGRHVPQSRGYPSDSVAEWTKLQEKVEDTDILLFLTIGTNHIPRPEDWPVMPAEHLRVVLKPVGFFRNNPSLDVKAPSDKCSRSAFPVGDLGTGAVVDH